MNQPLSVELVGDTQLKVVRRFAASPQRVWDAHWQPELIQKWMLGPPGWSMPICEAEAKVGAKIRFRWEDGEGNGFEANGEVKELDAPSRSVHTEHYDMPGATPVTCETLYTADGDGTRLELTMTFTSAAEREAALATGMADGMESSYARLDAI